MCEMILLGGGKIGACIAALLTAAGDVRLTVADRDEAALAAVGGPDCARRVLSFEDPAQLRAAIAGHRYVLSAAPFHLTPTIAAAAGAAGAHYFDLTEDVESTRRVRALADGAATAFTPQCGVAPGFVSIAAQDLARRFDTLDAVRMRVGALPQFPSNALKYNLTWSTDGLINEYCNPCEAIQDGLRREVAPLEGVERLSFDGVEYEAFNTSGGLGTLCETLAGRVRTLDYKTIRYPGHRDIVRLLVEELRLGAQRDLLKTLLEAAVPMTRQDVVLIFVTVSGRRAGRLTQETYARKIRPATIAGGDWTAIQITTAAAICAMVELHRQGHLPATGFIRQEDASLAAFLGTRFGRHFA